jgi:hypothetical protein
MQKALFLLPLLFTDSWCNERFSFTYVAPQASLVHDHRTSYVGCVDCALTATQKMLDGEKALVARLKSRLSATQETLAGVRSDLNSTRLVRDSKDLENLRLREILDQSDGIQSYKIFLREENTRILTMQRESLQREFDDKKRSLSTEFTNANSGLPRPINFRFTITQRVGDER